MEESNTLNTL